MLASSNDRWHQPSAAVRHHHHHPPNPHSLDYNIWAEMLVKSNRNSFGRHDSGQNFGPWTRRPLSQLTNAAAADDDDDELKYPPPATPNSRAQMIEKYRQEMIELVRNMPEEEGDAYELSLRDIVEHPAARKPEVDATESGEDVKRNLCPASRGEKKRVTELIMKAFMPGVRAALGGRKRIAGVGGGKGAKVSPKPSHSDCDDRSLSSDSSNSRGRSNRRSVGSCYIFLHRKRSNSMEI